MKLLPLIFGMIGLISILIIYNFLKRYSFGTEKIKKIGKSIYSGSMLFISYEYKILSIFCFFIFIALFYMLGKNTAFSFIIGALCSAIAGFIGMYTATQSNMKTTYAAYKSGIKEALTIAFLSFSLTSVPD